MWFGGCDVRESLVMVAWAGSLQVVSRVRASFPSRAGAGELPPSSSWSSWAREKQHVSAGLERGRRQRGNGGEAWSKTAAIATFFSGAGRTKSSLSVRERSRLALGSFW
jgi:hypothetical protein